MLANNNHDRFLIVYIDHCIIIKYKVKGKELAS